MKTKMMTGIVEIKKYANRKLYSVETTTYLSMLELSDMVAGGARVRVTCDVTGRDITSEVLSRSLYERMRDRDPSGSDNPFPPERLACLFPLVSRRRRGA